MPVFDPAFEKKHCKNTQVREMKLKLEKMHKKIQQFDILDNELDIKPSTNRSESIKNSHPHAFVKNVLTREQIRELCSPRDIKKLKLAQKRNS